MMTNLFSIFDPSTNIYLSSNWLSMMILMLILPSSYWLITNRFYMMVNMMTNYVLNEFFPLMKKNPQTLILPLTLFLMLVMNNLPGLLPFVFTATSHLSMTLTLAMPLWLGLMIHGWLFNTTNLLIHLIPNGTPTMLMPFMVVIETISNIIRPITLSIRLAANMIAGHLLITLLTSANPVLNISLKPVLLISQMSLAGLEIAVAFIQAYVFSVLLTLYTAESVN